jgi:hypothetical protein
MRDKILCENCDAEIIEKVCGVCNHEQVKPETITAFKRGGPAPHDDDLASADRMGTPHYNDIST